MSTDERFDEVLLNIAGQLGGIEPLFDTLFSFLYRKTDYFHVMKPGDKIGFKAGVAQQILLRSFGRFESQAALVAKRAAAATAEQPAKQPAAAASARKPSASAPAGQATTTAATAPATAAPAAPAVPSEPSKPPPPPASTGKAAGISTSKGTEAASAAGAKSSSHLSQQVGVPYNGGRCANYWWEQTLNDVTISAPVPAGTKGRDVICTIGKSHMTLKLRGSAEPLLDADYPCDARNGQEIWERVRTVDCYWNLAESRGEPCVCVYLEKERESWWKSALHGHEEIDTTKVDSTRDMYDYDNETQGAIRKIMFDQHQKRLGKPTSDELKNEDMLRSAWDAEGSPFKGQPFDPSMINLSGGGGGMGGGMAGGMAGGMGMPPMPSEAEQSRITEVDGDA